MKLSEIKGERAIEVFADLLDPVVRIISDDEILAAFKDNEKKVVIIQKMLKKHPKEIIEAMAIIDGIPVEEYKANVDFLTFPAKLIEFFNDEAVAKLFTSQSQNETEMNSGSAMENIEDEKS